MVFERLHPNTNEWQMYYANHIVRYQFASTILKDSSIKENILDIACGVGYGSAYLESQGIKGITGADISEEAIRIAKTAYKSDHIDFIVDDGCNPKQFNQKKYNAIVSFETIEHLKQPELFLTNIKNCGNENCQLIISSPNVLVTGHTSKKDWHFHEKEYTPTEFYQLFKNLGYKNIKIYGQVYSQSGNARNDIRSELNRLHFNPFMRLGEAIQRILRGIKFGPVLPEKIEDFEIVEFDDPESIEKLGKNGPFVLINVLNL